MESEAPARGTFKGARFHPQMKTLLQTLYDHAHMHVQVFGVFPPAASCIKLKEEIDRGEKVAWGSYNIYAHATVLLNSLQRLDDPVLTHRMYKDWMELIGTPKSLLSMKAQILRLCKLLPLANQIVLKHVLVILRRICQNVPRTHTTPILAGHFVGPYLLWEPKKKPVPHPAEDFHYQLAKLVKHLIIFMDDIWNDIDKEVVFEGPSLFPSTLESKEDKNPFLKLSAAMFVEELCMESSRNSLLEEMINSPWEYKPFRSSVPLSYRPSPSTTASSQMPLDLSKMKSRSSRTWPGYLRKPGVKDDGPPDKDKPENIGSDCPSDKAKVATFPRCSPSSKEQKVAEDVDTGFHSSGEQYLYPDWVFLYPLWHLHGDDLPGWARSGFTLDTNSLAERTMHKWKRFFTDLLKSTAHSPRKHISRPGRNFKAQNRLDAIRPK